MQPSTLLTIAAFPALFAAVMGAKCNPGAVLSNGTDVDCNAVDQNKLTALLTCNTFDADCSSALLTLGAPADVALLDQFAKVMAKDAKNSMKVAGMFSKIKAKIGSFTGAAANTIEANEKVFDGLVEADLDQLNALVIPSINDATFAKLDVAFFKSLSKTTAGHISDAQLAKMTEAQAAAVGIDAPAADTKADELTKKKDASACKVLTEDAKLKKITDDKVKTALKTRCKWASSASAVQVTLFLTAASLASVFLMNTLAF